MLADGGNNAIKLLGGERQQFPRDSGAEWEPDLSGQLAQYLTSSDGKVVSLFEANGKLLPDWARGELQLARAGVSVEEGTFQDLDGHPDLQARIMRAAIRRETGNFKDPIPGLRFRNMLKIQPFREVTSIFGRPVNSNDHSISAPPELLPVIEFRSPHDMKLAGGLEIKFRSSRPPEDLVRDIWNFQKILGLDPEPLHLHLVRPRFHGSHNRESSGKTSYASARRTEILRQWELIGQMVSIVYAGATFGFHDFNQFEGLMLAHSWIHRPLGQVDAPGLTGLLEGAQNSDGSSMSNGYYRGFTAFHPPGKYDVADLMGFELRFIDPSLPYDLIRHIVQKARSEFDGLDNAKVKMFNAGSAKRWLENRSNLILKRKINILDLNAYDHDHAKHLSTPDWYLADFVDILSEAPDDLTEQLHLPSSFLNDLRRKASTTYRRSFLADNGPPQLKEFRNVFNSHMEIAMLFHDWSIDPTLFENAEILEVIRLQQKMAILRILHGQNVTHTMTTFLLDSGLLKHFLSLKELQIP